MIGKYNKTAIGTLVERSTGYAMLVSLPDGYKPEHVAPALTRKIKTLPERNGSRGLILDQVLSGSGRGDGLSVLMGGDRVGEVGMEPSVL